MVGGARPRFAVGILDRVAISITSLEAAHLDEAARLVAIGADRCAFPFADGGLEMAVRDALGNMNLDTGVVALRDGRVAGFLVGFATTLFTGLPGVYVPEWGHATDGDPSLYGPMYRSASARWVAGGAVTHAITLFAEDHGALESWFGMGFGKHLVDGVRRVEACAPIADGIEIRLADEGDLAAAVAMDAATAAHLSSSPVFLDRSPDDEASLLAQLADPERPAFVAVDENRVIGWVTAKPSGEAPRSIRRSVPMSIDGAYVYPEFRRSGVAASLVDALVDAASGQGIEMIAVDYETANLEAAAFWPRCGFEPVLISVARTIGPQSAGS